MAQAVTSATQSSISVDALPINTGKERATTPTSDPLSETSAQVQPNAVELELATSSKASSSSSANLDPNSITAKLFNGNDENAGDISLTKIQKDNQHYQIRETGSDSWVSADSKEGAELLRAAKTSGQNSFLQA